MSFRKPTYLAASHLLYGIGLAAFWLLERVGLMTEEHDEPPRLHTALWHVYQWCMCTSARLDEWDALWKSAGDSARVP